MTISTAPISAQSGAHLDTTHLDATRDDAAVARERDHYDEHKRYILHFLERDRTPFERFILRHTLLTWDRHVAFLDREWFTGKRVVEVGCGNPRHLSMFLAWGASSAVGVDLSEAFVRRGLAHPTAYVYDQSMPARGDDMELRFGDFCGDAGEGLTADTVCCFQSLHHIDLPRFTATCARVVGPGGIVAISDPVGDHPLRRLGNAVGRWSGLLSDDERALPAGRVADEFRRTGFEQILFRPLNPTAEIYFHLTELVTPLSPTLAIVLKTPLAPWRVVEDWIENRILPSRPHWGWRYLSVFRKGGTP